MIVDAEAKLEQVHAEYLAARDARKTHLDRHNARVNRLYSLPKVIAGGLWVLNILLDDAIEKPRPWVEKLHQLQDAEVNLRELATDYAAMIPGTYPFRSLTIAEYGKGFELGFNYDDPERRIHLSPTLSVACFYREWSDGEKIVLETRNTLAPILHLPLVTQGVTVKERVVEMGPYASPKQHVWRPDLKRKIALMYPTSLKDEINTSRLATTG